MTTLLTKEEKELLSRAANLMEELLETIKFPKTKQSQKNSKVHSEKQKKAKLDQSQNLSES